MQYNHIIPDNFWNIVQKSDDESCWPWMGSINKNTGYGFASTLPAHRIAYELTYGAIPEGRLILQKCGNRRCVNPSHLYAGTHADNARDILARQPDHYFSTFGGNSGKYAKLAWNQVRDIRVRAYMLMDTNADLAREYDVNPNTITAILFRKSWKKQDHEIPPIYRLHE